MNLLDDGEIRSLSAKLQQNAANGLYQVSDLILEQDGQTYQFVDLVMEGGGALGIALVGYVYALEQANIRFLGVGGSSAGAIVALLLSCLDKRTVAKGDRLAAILSEMDMLSFIDGSFFAAALSKLLGKERAVGKKIRGFLLFILSSGSLMSRLGWNPGKKFLAWLTVCLNDAGVYTMDDAKKIIDYMPADLKHRIYGRNFVRPEASLKMVAADITTSSKVVFPQMAPLYWKDPDALNPALFARASMSIPGFFQPMVVRGISKLSNIEEKWFNLCAFEGKIPDKITFSDGGLLSNFPISLFHQPRVPNAPTFGARLGSYSRVVSEISSIGGYAWNLFNSLRHHSDYDFIYQNPDYQRLIAYIPTSGHNWLNFQMSDEEKRVLFRKGMKAAYDFLEEFDWHTYKEIRREQQALAMSLSRLRKPGRLDRKAKMI
ncbi:MAG: patatin-like phospholipase family protein [Symbiobacteriaceae bacterium]|nr:patatin-like phospholipase family protein [Symbiobacteriaceae bacterium]